MIKKNESDEHITPNKGGWQDGGRGGRRGRPCVLGGARGSTGSKGESLLSKRRDTPKGQSCASEMTGKALKLGRDGQPSIALIPTDSGELQSHTQASYAGPPPNCSVRGCTDDSKDNTTMAAIRMRPVLGQTLNLCCINC